MADELKRVEVEWIDSCRMMQGWDTADSYRGDATIEPKVNCVSAGYLVEDSERGIIVALSRSSDHEHVADGMFIPRSAVKSVRELRRK
jgi:hypothetical protein